MKDTCNVAVTPRSVVAGIADPGPRPAWLRRRPAGIDDPGYNRLGYCAPFLTFALLLSFGANPLLAADANVEAKMREQLRNTMLQLRTAQNDKAALEAQQAENAQKLKALTVQVEALTKQAGEAEKTSAAQAVELGKFKEAIEKWKVAYEQSSTVASAKEGERAKLAESSITLQRRVADLQTRNAGLFKLANEILHRYERFSLGDALAAKEPFTGITRVKLENLVQDYQDKLAEQKARP